jgi:polyisoprenoid-binding protein YceI
MSTIAQNAATLPAGTWNLDGVHSQVSFAVRYHVGTFRGSFSPVTGALEVNEDGTATLTGSAPVSGVQVQDPNLNGHLMAPDFFDAEISPELSFRSTAITPTDDGIDVSGELTIKGTTLPVKATGTISETTEYMGHPYFGLTLQTTIDRNPFGIRWQNPLPNGDPALGDDVVITAELFFNQPPAAE